MKRPQGKDLYIRHSVPGRVRLKIKALQESPEYRQTLENDLNQATYLKRVQVRSLTGSLVIFYDPALVQVHELVDLIAQTLPDTGAALPTTNTSSLVSRLPISSGPGFMPSLLSPGRLWNVVALSGALAYSLVRRFVMKLSVAQNPTSFIGMVASFGTFSLVSHSLLDIYNRRRFGLYPFLSVASALAIFMGEALTAIEVLWVLAVGTFVEQLIAEKSRKTIRDLLIVAPAKTFVLVGEAEIETAIEQVTVGDTVVVRDGDRIPVDGTILRGSALVDEAHISGRSEPQLRDINNHVYAGTRIVQGTLFIRSEKVGDDTYLSRVLKLVEDSLEVPTELENKADVLANRLVRFGTVATFSTLLLTQSLTRSLAVLLMMSCPCATVLATSTAIAAAIANAARRGILIKGGRFLESTEAIDAIVFDKTGTITLEVPEIVEVVTRAPWQETSQLLELAASAEIENNHPVARALVGQARKEGLQLAKDVRSEMLLGQGVRAEWDSEVVLVGSAQFMMDHGVNPSYFRAKAEKYQNTGNSVIYIARDEKLQGMIVLGNRVRPHTDTVMAWLREDGVACISLVSGDALPIIETLAASMAFDEFHAEILPDEKAQYIDSLRASGKRVMMVGDGLNDALALSKADVGVAMGSGGSEVAIEAADIALLDNDLEGLVKLRKLSHRSFEVIEQNFWLATATNLVGVGLSMFGIVAPVMAGLLHTVHSLGITLNSSRLLTMDLPASTAKE